MRTWTKPGQLQVIAAANNDDFSHRNVARTAGSGEVGRGGEGGVGDVHHVEPHLRIRQADGKESAQRFQACGSVVSGDGGGGAIFSPQAAAAAPPVQPRLLEVAGNISATLAGT